MKPIRVLFIITISCMLLGSVITAVNGQGESNEELSESRTEQIQITADRLESSRNEGFVEFTGKVEAVQGQFQIRSDRLRVYYAEDINTGNPVSDTEAIKRILAYGNVRIRTERAEAKTDQAEYRVADTLLILTGDNSTVTSEKNFIIGSKITLNRTTGQITVEGKPGKRVRAVFYPDEELKLHPEGE